MTLSPIRGFDRIRRDADRVAADASRKIEDARREVGQAAERVARDASKIAECARKDIGGAAKTAAEFAGWLTGPDGPSYEDLTAKVPGLQEGIGNVLDEAMRQPVVAGAVGKVFGFEYVKDGTSTPRTKVRFKATSAFTISTTGPASCSAWISTTRSLSFRLTEPNTA